MSAQVFKKLALPVYDPNFGESPLAPLENAKYVRLPLSSESEGPLGRFVSNQVEINAAFPDSLRGDIDIDSYLVAVEDLIHLRFPVDGYIYSRIRKYDMSQNAKLYIELDKIVKEQHPNYDPAKARYVEMCIGNAGRENIHLLLAVRKSGKDRWPYFHSDITKIIIQAVLAMGKQSSTSKRLVLNKEEPEEKIKIALQDWPAFASYFVFYLKEYLSTLVDSETNEPRIFKFFFYKAVHGMKCTDIPAVLETIIDSLMPDANNYLIQTHVGVTLTPKDDELMFLDREVLRKQVDPGCVFDFFQNFFLVEKYGHMFGFRGAPSGPFKKIVYAHCYQTIHHKFTDKSFITSLFLYALLSGAKGYSFSNFCKLARNKLDELVDFLKGYFEQLDFRFEIVESWKNVEVLVPRNFPRRWEAGQGLGRQNTEGSLILALLDKMFEKDCFVVLDPWRLYLGHQIGHEVDVIAEACFQPKCAPSYELLTALYAAETSTVSFAEGHFQRSDVTLMRQLFVHDHCKMFRRCRFDFFDIDDATFTRMHHLFNWLGKDDAGTDWAWVVYQSCRKQPTGDSEEDQRKRPFDQLKTFGIFDDIDDARLLIRFLMQRVAVVREYSVDSTRIVNADGIDPDSYFSVERTSYIHNVAISNSDVMKCFRRCFKKEDKRPMLFKMMVSMAVGDHLESGIEERNRFSSELVSNLEQFIVEKVFYIPTFFVDPTVDPRFWSVVLKSDEIEQIQKCLSLQNYSGEIIKQLNLTQNKNLKERRLVKDLIQFLRESPDLATDMGLVNLLNRGIQGLHVDEMKKQALNKGKENLQDGDAMQDSCLSIAELPPPPPPVNFQKKERRFDSHSALANDDRNEVTFKSSFTHSDRDDDEGDDDDDQGDVPLRCSLPLVEELPSQLPLPLSPANMNATTDGTRITCVSLTCAHTDNGDYDDYDDEIPSSQPPRRKKMISSNADDEDDGDDDEDDDVIPSSPLPLRKKKVSSTFDDMDEIPNSPPPSSRSSILRTRKRSWCERSVESSPVCMSRTDRKNLTRSSIHASVTAMETIEDDDDIVPGSPNSFSKRRKLRWT